MLSETKHNLSFPKGQFCIDTYTKPYKMERNPKGKKGILFNVREEIASNLIKPLPHQE